MFAWCELPCHVLHILRSCIICVVHRVVNIVCWFLFPVFPVSIESASVSDVRTRSTTSVRLLQWVVLLPSGISGKMIISPDTITIIAMLVYRFHRLCLVTYHLLNISLSTMPWNLQPVQPSKPLIGYVTACLTLLIALLVAGAVASMQNMVSLLYHHI